MEGKKEMEIKEPKFKVGDKVTNPQKGREVFGTIARIKYYDFPKGTYIYTVKFERDGFTEELYIDELFLDAYIEKPKTVWDLKNDDTYYLIDTDGDVMNATWNDIDIDIDSKFRKIGNVFLTKEEAENDVERRKIETEMLRLGGRREFKNGENNHYIVCDFDTHYSIFVFNNKSDGFAPMTIYFDSAKECRNAIETIGEDRIKKYVFNVKE